MTFRYNKYPLLSLFSSHIIEYPTPINLNYTWSFDLADYKSTKLLLKLC